jgi:hypothetical protein
VLRYVYFVVSKCLPLEHVVEADLTNVVQVECQHSSIQVLQKHVLLFLRINRRRYWFATEHLYFNILLLLLIISRE